MKPSYNVKAIKAMSFEQFVKAHKASGADYYKYFSEKDWENEYEAITGKQLSKVEKTEIKKGE